MGGRSSGSGMAGNQVPYDEWGKMMAGLDAEDIRDKDGTIIGQIEDSTRYLREQVIEKVTKKSAIDEAFSYKNDDGTFGDDDIQIYATYADGSTWSSDSGQNKGLKKSGLIGVSISTPDSETAWGEDYVGRGRDRRRVPNRLSYDPDTGEEGPANSHKWYRISGMQKVRHRVTYNNYYPNGRRYTKRELIRESTVKEV